MRFFRLMAIGVVLLAIAGVILGTACAGAKGEQGPQGEPGPNMIVAMGNIESGVVQQGYNITSCVWDDSAQAYVITLTGIDYEASNYVTLVTPAGPNITTYSSLNGKLYVYVLLPNSITGIEGGFCFMVLATPQNKD